METANPLRDLIARGALFVVNHSGGKDSQAMAAYLRGLVPASQLLVVHALDKETVTAFLRVVAELAP